MSHHFIIFALPIVFLLFLYALAFVGNRNIAFLNQYHISRQTIYIFSIGVYCTSWTFYGAVGSAARNGFEFVTIYLGPSLVFFAWWFILRKMLRIGKLYHITSIADFISSRYGKSQKLGVLTTLIAITVIVPYISLQLQAVTQSLQVMCTFNNDCDNSSLDDNALLVGIIVGLFAIVFGTSKLASQEQHNGIVLAIAFESIIKLIAFMAIGVYVVFILFDSPFDLFAQAKETLSDHKLYHYGDFVDSRWLTMIFLSAAAIICLPRQYHIIFTENNNEKDIIVASWAFPLYLFFISLFVVPITFAGLLLLPASSNPDFFILSLPLSQGDDAIAILAFLGGFSSATSMMILSSLALAIMVTNHILLPILISIKGNDFIVTQHLHQRMLFWRRVVIAFVMALGLFYYYIGNNSDALAEIGLISFVGVAQFIPALIGGLFWRGGSEKGAFYGLIIGALIWFYTMLVPNFVNLGFIDYDIMRFGLFSLSFLKPHSLFGDYIIDPLTHALIWSLGANILIYLIISLLSNMKPIEHWQSAIFVDVFQRPNYDETRIWQRSALLHDIENLCKHILGKEQAEDILRQYAHQQGKTNDMPDMDDGLIPYVERYLSGNIGASSAQIMLSGIIKGEMISMNEIMGLLDETRRAIDYSQRLEEQSQELISVAGQLRTANNRLTQIDNLKDEFLSTATHELRTPLTALRSFSHILLSNHNLSDDKRQEFYDIIHQETLRLTNLLDQLLNLQQIENGLVDWQYARHHIGKIITDVCQTLHLLASDHHVEIITNINDNDIVYVDQDRLKQVLMNIIANAIKFHDKDKNAFVKIDCTHHNDKILCSISDNGPGIAVEHHPHLFEKFVRFGDAKHHIKGSGLGLAISKQIIENMEGTLEFDRHYNNGARFVICFEQKGE